MKFAIGDKVIVDIYGTAYEGVVGRVGESWEKYPYTVRTPHMNTLLSKSYSEDELVLVE